jgi:hypothetical protein
MNERNSGGGLWKVTLFAAALCFLVLPLAAAPKEVKPQGFATPEDAVQALVDAAKKKDAGAILKIFGSAGEDLLKTEDEVQDAQRREKFIAAYEEIHSVVKKSDDQAELILGKDHWPFPVPIIKEGKKWFFDVEAGREEILNRRIGNNELSTIKVFEAYVQAQREYNLLDYDQDEVLEYAQKVMSAEGLRDGLFWPTAEGETPSPFGPFVADAAAEGYKKKEGGPAPYHGYYYKVLTAQGPDAAGGAFSYLVNGNMVAGYAMVAWPADYGNTGIVTFVVNSYGTIYEKDLGEKTGEIAGALNAYNPDATWKRAK